MNDVLGVLPVGGVPAIFQGGAGGSLFTTALTRALGRDRGTLAALNAGRVRANALRMDSIAKEFRNGLAPEEQPRFDSAIAMLKRTMRGDSARADAFTASAGYHMARQLEHIYAEVLLEPSPPNSALDLFPVNTTSVALGARTHTVRRMFTEGEAAVYHGGNAGIPRVGLTQQEEQFPVRYYVTAFGYNVFEQAASGFANTAMVQDHMRAARDVLLQFLNRKTWFGDSTNGIYGIINYPYLDKKSIATAFDGSASPDDVIEELNRLANWPMEQSKGTYRPTAVVMSPRVRNYLMTTPRASGSDETIGSFWLKTNTLGITSILSAWELTGAGPSGTDGILFFAADAYGIDNVVPSLFSTLPVQSMGFDDMTFCFAAHGGVVMRNVGCNILGWVDATP